MEKEPGHCVKAFLEESRRQNKNQHNLIDYYLIDSALMGYRTPWSKAIIHFPDLFRDFKASKFNTNFAVYREAKREADKLGWEKKVVKETPPHTPPEPEKPSGPKIVYKAKRMFHV